MVYVKMVNIVTLMAQNTQGWLLKQSLTNRMRFKKMSGSPKQILNDFSAQPGSLFDALLNNKQCFLDMSGNQNGKIIEK